jgi:hypothetical protein
MAEWIRQPDDPDAVDSDAYRTPDDDEPGPGREVGDDEEMMHFPGAAGGDVVGSGPDAVEAPGEEPEAPDAVGTTDEPW